MAYTHDINKLADKFKEDVAFKLQPDHKYRVYIPNVYFKIERDIKVPYHVPIFGLGYTIEDAANDFFRKARTGFLYHAVSNQVEQAV